MPFVLPGIFAGLEIGLDLFVAFIILYGVARASQVLTGSSNPDEPSGIWGWSKQILFGSFLTTAKLVSQKSAAAANKAIRTAFSHWAVAHLKPITSWLSDLSTLLHYTYKLLGDLATSTEARIAHIVAVEIPREVAKGAADARARARSAVATAHHALREARAAQADAERLFGRAMRGIDYLKREVTQTIPRELDRIRTAEQTLEREIPAGLRSRLKTLEKAVAFGAIAAVVLRVLAKRFPWLFCRKVKTAGKLVCGMDEDLFGALLTDALLLAGTFSLAEFARELATVEAQAIGPILDFWQAR